MRLRLKYGFPTLAQMTPEEFADAKSLWKFFYANECFKHVENACSFILQSGMDEKHPAYFPLITAIYVLYGKPFKSSRVVGKLSKEFVPPKFRELHDLMIMHRDQLYAHTDAHNFDDPFPGVPNQVRVRRVSSEARMIGTEFYARPPVLPHVIALCREMQKKTSYHINKLQNRHFKKHLPKGPGEYPINVFNMAGPFFLPKQPPFEP